MTPFKPKSTNTTDHQFTPCQNPVQPQPKSTPRKSKPTTNSTQGAAFPQSPQSIFPIPHTSFFNVVRRGGLSSFTSYALKIFFFFSGIHRFSAFLPKSIYKDPAPCFLTGYAGGPALRCDRLWASVGANQGSGVSCIS